MQNNYQWHGQPVKVRFGYVYQKENIDKPLYWYNFECCNRREGDGFREDHMTQNDGRKFALMPAIEVSQDGQTWLIANHYGIGVNKLLKGGWPNATHFGLEGEFKEDKAPYYKFTKFDLEEYEWHESNRRAWQKANYPQEFERMESLRRSIQKLQEKV